MYLCLYSAHDHSRILLRNWQISWQEWSQAIAMTCCRDGELAGEREAKPRFRTQRQGQGRPSHKGWTKFNANEADRIGQIWSNYLKNSHRIGQIHWVEFPSESALNLYVHQCQTWVVARSQTMLYSIKLRSSESKTQTNATCMQTHTASRNKTLNRESCKHLQTFIAVIRTCILEYRSSCVLFLGMIWLQVCERHQKKNPQDAVFCAMIHLHDWPYVMHIIDMFKFIFQSLDCCLKEMNGNEVWKERSDWSDHTWCPVEAQQWNCNYFRSNRVALRKAFCLHFVTLTASGGVDHQCWMECRDKGAEMSWERGASMIALLPLSGSNSPSMRNLSALFCAYQEVFGPGPENSMKLVSAGGIKPTSASTLAQIRIVKLHDVCH